MAAGGAGETSCNGDSGGPLVCEVDGRWYQVSALQCV
ncbi:MAG: trypsin-like serine protease [bacterium]